MSTLTIRQLCLDDVYDIVADEQVSFVPSLQARPETIVRRFELNHLMIGAFVEDKIVGKICFSYSGFSPDNRAGFPTSFVEFSSIQTPTNYDAAFVYNLNVNPAFRRFPVARKLIHAMIEKAKEDNCRYIVIDGRCQSYNGNPSERIRQKSGFRQAIVQYLEHGVFPKDSDFCQDPLLAFYHRLGGRFLWVMPNFFPEDTPTGGLRIIMYKEIRDDKP